MKQILLDERISPQAKGFYLLMCEATIGGITLSSEELAKLSGYSKNTVLKFIKELKKFGYVDTHYYKTVTTRGGSNVIYACVDN